MKKSTLFTSITFALITLLSFSVTAQDFSGLDKSPMDVAAYPSDYKDANKLVKITYSRPQLKGRTLEKLTPNGDVWRTGANEAAEITFYENMKMGDQTITAGTYTFYVIPGAEEWTAIINTDLNVWGSYFYNKANDVARLSVPAKEADESLEAFSIAFKKSDDGVDMHLGWDKTRVTVPFTK
ncbi:DUF2911 domain-containing protein [Lacinutrix neustonica]|uniref:DUF2911 domain-containing protein n=1 Tax=Lacinutrix neustonica TaxID=2980107 RepID=A0A9E8SD58_9FLAO|nr:DUF2911 domain-containing protein [Lacinutrix neustonica]WAC01746.1 DUF2911 domain-containing protein [Lacinutrix neustonica]